MEKELAEALRRTAESVAPKVSDLVDEGVRQGRRRMRRRRTASVSAVTAVAAATVVASVTTGAGMVGGDGGPGTTDPSELRLASATQVLKRAAEKAQARPETRPRPDQWAYAKTLEQGVATGHGERPAVQETWTRMDGTQDAWFDDGKLVVHRQLEQVAGSVSRRYARLGTLPTSPGALRTVIYKEIDAIPQRDRQGPDRDGEAFRTAAQMLWDAPLGFAPKTQAALYRVLAQIPGVRVDAKVKDGAGRPAIAISRGFGEQFLLDPATYQVVGQRTVSNGRNAPQSKNGGVDSRFAVPPGTVTYSLTLLTVKVVDKAGQR
ncbi:CU044_5270 family protein [Spirillospora sp. CA-142024]|uniref:CU044_5270 family protein n=1 Tax=Spirillospora sp. CA-142024 TaxID=3240036 RepID=UPI003D8EA109